MVVVVLVLVVLAGGITDGPDVEDVGEVAFDVAAAAAVLVVDVTDEVDDSAKLFKMYYKRTLASLMIVNLIHT